MKHADWKHRLNEFLLIKKDIPFEWGKNDCLFFVSDAVEAMSGMDLVHNLRGQYSDKRGAILKMRIKHSFEEYMTRIFDEVLVRKDPKDVQYGDIVMAYVKNIDPEATGRTAGIINKNGYFIGPGKFGTMYVTDAKIDLAWGIKEEAPTQGRMINWPVVTGCYRLSEGCYSCPSYWEYLEEGKDYSPKIHDDVLSVPIMNPEPTTYNVAFGSDLFHPDVPPAFIYQVFAVMNNCPQHKFEILTKRTNQVVNYNNVLLWTENISLGVPVESAEYKWRIDQLRYMGAQTKFISMAPLLGPMGQLDLTGIHLVGAVEETWGYKRPAKKEWFDDVERQCLEQGVVYNNSHIIYENKEDEVLRWQE